MSLTIKAEDIPGVLGALQAMDGRVPLGTELSFKVARMRRELNNEAKTVEEQREAIVLEHGAKSKEGVRLVPGSEGYEEGKKKLKELLEQEITLSNVDPLPARKLFDKLEFLDQEPEEDEEDRRAGFPIMQVLEALIPILDDVAEAVLDGSGNRSERRQKRRRASP